MKDPFVSAKIVDAVLFRCPSVGSSVTKQVPRPIPIQAVVTSSPKMATTPPAIPPPAIQRPAMPPPPIPARTPAPTRVATTTAQSGPSTLANTTARDQGPRVYNPQLHDLHAHKLLAGVGAAHGEDVDENFPEAFNAEDDSGSSNGPEERGGKRGWKLPRPKRKGVGR